MSGYRRKLFDFAGLFAVESGPTFITKITLGGFQNFFQTFKVTFSDFSDHAVFFLYQKGRKHSLQVDLNLINY